MSVTLNLSDDEALELLALLYGAEEEERLEKFGEEIRAETFARIATKLEEAR